MNVKTMEGLAGANASIHLMSTPMGIAKEAENKGDTEKMKRALSYASQMTDQAEAYGEKTSKGMELDAEEAKKQEELRQEEWIQARRKEREELEKKVKEGEEASGEAGLDSVEISGEGKYQAEMAAPSADNAPDVVYDKSGEAVEAAAETGENINVSV